MSVPKLVSPLLDGYIMGEPLSEHHGVCCCPAIRENTDERYIVKIISIPASQVQLDALLLSGAYADEAEALAYFKDLSEGVIGEADILKRLSRLEGYLPYSGSQVVQMEDGVGYDVYLISPYNRTLEKQMRVNPLTHLAAVNLGLDMCAALSACRRAGYLYADLKPGNIFVTEIADYRIGDLGFIPLKSLKYASLPEKYRSQYTAPEVADAMSSLNDSIDIYALGLTLYQVYNNGQLPFDGPAPTQPLPPPLYADYEMAEIILKACALNPADRWADPAQMGQELVNYMQRNCINDTPIVPPPVELEDELPEEPEEFLSEDENDAQIEELLAQLPEDEQPPEISDEEQPSEVPEDEDDVPVSEEEAPACDSEPDAEEDETDISFIDDEPTDETLPTAESAADLDDTSVTDEVAEMLAQADELIAHELPEPVVAPEPIDVPIPPPIQPDVEPEPEPEEDEDWDLDEWDDEPSAPATAEQTEEPEEEENDSENEDDFFFDDDQDDEDETEDSIDEDEDFFDDEELPAPPPKKKKRIGMWVSIAIATLVLIGAIFAGWYFYNHYYLQTIDDLTLEANANQLIVAIDAEVDETLLTVTCTDTYGNALRSSVSNGKAEFKNLNPNTQYKIQVSISGPHKLVGKTSHTHTTPPQTEILNFTGICGPEDGSVILNFSVNGPESDVWMVEYGADGIAPLIREFSGHSVTITGLTVGADYTFRLVPKDALHLIGTNELRFTAQNIIYAQNLTISACGGGSLTAVWAAPQGAEGITWSVRCYNDAGYDETITTAENSVEFTGLDHTTGYTVQVIAIGMTQSASTTVTANPITVTGFTTDTSVPRVLTLNWSFDGTAPTGWVLVYSINNGAPVSLECATNSASIPLFPGMHYDFRLTPVDDVTFFCEGFIFDAPEATPFSGYLVSAADMTFAMCLTPNVANWDRYDLKGSDYTTTFTVGQKASFLVKLAKQYGISTDEIVTTFVIRDANHHLIITNSTTQTWKKMWHKYYCELDIPQMPSIAGAYTIDIYFNDMLVTSQTFTIQ